MRQTFMAQAPPFLKTLSRKSFVLFMLGVFFVFSAVGFASDVTTMGRTQKLHFVLSIFVSGIFPVFYAIAGFALRKHFWKAFFPVFAVHFYIMNVLGGLPRTLNGAAQVTAPIQGRLVLDAYSIMLAVALGYACFVYVTITEGRRYFRVRAEIELATEIHQVLVPVVETKIGGYEFYGRSVPSGEVGGDLIDVAGSDDHWVAYLADVSGHGVAPGLVMGMVKSAARMLLSSGESAAQLMPRLNEVLYPLKKPEMFVTFCFVARNADGLRVGLAGHPAILRFSASTNNVEPLECPNMPLGILPEGEFTDSEIHAEPGDVFALYTDGFLEPENAAGEEYGIARLQAEFQKLGKQSLPTIYLSLRESVARHGAQFDDQSLLLIRKMQVDF
jgi:Stage II sporulation protein E (SpoIIE)